ncbi:MAG TPA: TIGR03118 family protein, partial [Urbifossiella sp.]|nr:TIGR03118 family protein [Urbifossiella sp.]
MSSARRYGSRSRTTALRMEQLEERWVPSVAGAFLETPLVSDQTGVAPITDADLVNGWGIAMNPTSGGFWVSSNGANLTDIYTGDVNGTALAKAGLEVTIPGGAPTGQVFNPTTDFVVTSGATSGPAQFITASENGIVTGWNPNVPASSTTAQTAFTASDAAVYKGIALANNGAANFLYLADFHNNKIDVLDSSFHLTTLSGNFTDPNEATGFAPFNIAAINGQLYVSYALQDAAKHDDVAGAGNGYIDVFDLNGNFVKRLVSQGALNSPWGMVQAPAGFSNLGGDLLVGNFGDGKINAYNATDGTLIGSLDTANGQPMVIDGLWGLTFGNGQTAGSTKTLYFAAGPDAEAHGLFGKITSPARGGNGIGSDVVAVSGQANGAAQLFNLHADGTLTAQGSPIS